MATSTVTIVAQWAAIMASALYTGVTAQYTLTMDTYIAHAPPRVLVKQYHQLYSQGPKWVPPIVLTAVLSNLFLAFSTPATGQGLRRQGLYLVAAALILSIFPYTFFVLEPGINGALKWKRDLILFGPADAIVVPPGHTKSTTTTTTTTTPAGNQGKPTAAAAAAAARGEPEPRPEETEEEEEAEVHDTNPLNANRLPPPSAFYHRPSTIRHSATEAAKRRAERTDVRDLVREWQRMNNPRWVVGLAAAAVSGWATLGRARG